MFKRAGGDEERNADVTAGGAVPLLGRKPPLSQLTLCMIRRGILSHDPLFIYFIFTAVDDWDAAMCESNAKMLASILGNSYSRTERVLADAGKAE